MKINAMSLHDRVNNLAEDLEVPHNIIYDRYFYDAFLLRLVKSKYKNSFVLKGGLYLSSLLGVETRNTIDIDFYLNHHNMEKQNLINIVNEIISIDIDDNVSFEYKGIENIRGDDEYGGFRIKVLGTLENVKDTFWIDVATGDPIVPSPKEYEYCCLVTNDILKLKAYSVESIVAEKVETVLSKAIANSRSKDYYDLFILRLTQKDKINYVHLKEAYTKTCSYRSFSLDKESALELVNEIRNNEIIKKRWIVFTNNSNYCHGLDFEKVMNAINDWVIDAYE